MSQQMCVTDKKVVIISGVQCITRNKPVKIFRIKQIPSRKPNFHHDEMFDGAGRSMNVLFTIFISGWDFQILVISVLVVE